MIGTLGKLIHLEYLIILDKIECFNTSYFRTEGVVKCLAHLKTRTPKTESPSYLPENPKKAIGIQ